MPNALAKLRSWIKPWIRPWETGADPMEIRRAVLEDIDSRAVAAGQGRRLFPFDRVRVEILAADAEERAVLEAVVDDWDLPRAVAERLREREVRVPEGLTVETTVVEGPIPEPGERRWKVVYEKTGRAAEAPASPTAARPAVELTVLKGRAKQRVYTLDTERIWIGRLEEVLDHAGRIKRRNDVAFLDESEESATVSREHARIAWDAGNRCWRLRDEQSASGTRIFREGRSIEVSGHDRQGVRLQPGDEVYFGKACVKIGMR
jgi:hypothetical protein